jgi:hypothetical protein
MKITTQLTVVIVSAVIGFVGLILGLAVFADWSDGAIIGLATAFGAVFVNTIIAVRNQAKTVESLADQDEKLIEQDVKLDTIVAQTNGMSEREKQEIAERAAISVVRQFRGDA